MLMFMSFRQISSIVIIILTPIIIISISITIIGTVAKCQQYHHQAEQHANQSSSLYYYAQQFGVEEDENDNIVEQNQDSRQSPGGAGVTGLFGQVAKTVIYGGAALAQLNSPILCPLLKHETDKDNLDQPILFVFNNNLNNEQAFRIYSDDDISEQIIEEAQFDTKQMTIILVHGWLGGIHKELWLSEAKNAALRSPLLVPSSVGQHEDYWRDRFTSSNNNNFRPNVIIVDWSEFASGTLYQATENSLKVSRRLARLLGELASVGGLQPALMHCLGHSIGTHICGQAARKAFPAFRLRNSPEVGQAEQSSNPPERRFGRITGLDPGGFCYELNIKNETTYLGLKPSDALLVDAYYSNRSPFGNRYQVAQYNVRVNNGYFQKPCSVWKNPDVARQYFRTAMKFAFGGSGRQQISDVSHEILTCDHYFATRFGAQMLPKICSYVGYTCDSYRNYLRGKCGLCDSPSQCYSMNFEYQLINPSIEHALRHIRSHSSFYLAAKGGSRQTQPLGGVPYEERPTYYMRIPDEEPYCSLTFRVRVALDRSVIDLRSFKADWIKLRFFASSGGHLNTSSSSSLKVKDANRGGRKTELLPLHGPWSATAIDELEATRTGLDERTLTALFELDSAAFHRLLRTSSNEQPPIEAIQVEYNNERLSRRLARMSNPIEFIQLDYLSTTDSRIRLKFSRLFEKDQFSVNYSKLFDGLAK